MINKYKNQFSDISNFLTTYDDIIKVEFLKRYPEQLPALICSWVNEIKSWNFSDLAELESNPHEELVKDQNFKNFLKTIRLLTNVGKIEMPAKVLDKSIKRKLNPKKIHEIERLVPLVHKIDCSTIIDIGGGIGNLSLALINKTEKNTICIDMNKDLQVIGKKKIKYWSPENIDKIKFEQQEFSENSKISADYNNSDTLLISLHGCGKLSTDIIKFSARNKIQDVVNIGCCYHKIDQSYNISEFSKDYNNKFTINALHLASRSGKIITEKDLLERFTFKRYRYSLHYLLFDELQIGFKALGNGSNADYKGLFSDYVNKYYSDNKVTDEELNTYFNQSKTIDKVKENFCADIIRMLLGRLIEVYILLDRAIYLSEKGRNVEIFEIFDRSISPRNIIIKSSLI